MLVRETKACRALLFLAVALVLAVPSPSAWAGPNAGGTLICHDPQIIVSFARDYYCDLGDPPATCEAADVEIDAGGTPALFKVYAAFPVGSGPRLMGLTFGVQYDGSALGLVGDKCGDFELPDAGWPAPGTGNSVTWNTVQTTPLVQVYAFIAASYYGTPVLFQLTPNPTQGGYFGDDSVPAVLDPIAGYGSMGFDMPGQVVCPGALVYGACCTLEGGCTILLEADCAPPSVWHPEWTSCDPNPCPQPPHVCCTPEGNCQLTEESQCQPPNVWHPELISCDPNPCPPPVPAESSSWGSIKATYR